MQTTAAQDYKVLALYGTARETLHPSDVIAAIKAGLKARSGKTWSVTRGRGTASSWLNISAPPSRCSEWGYMTDEDRAELGKLLGKDRPVHMQGESVPAGHDYYRAYLCRSAGLAPNVEPRPYWD